MPIAMSIERGGRVVLSTYTDPFSMAEVEASVIKMSREVFDHAQRPVHTINDMSKVTRLPANILSHTRSIMRLTHPMSGKVIVVIHNEFVNTIAEAARRIMPKAQINLYRTLDEAWKYADQLLSEQDALQNTGS